MRGLQPPYLEFPSEAQAAQRSALEQRIAAAGRAVRARPPGLPPLWCATERWPELQALLPGVAPLPPPRVGGAP